MPGMRIGVIERVLIVMVAVMIVVNGALALWRKQPSGSTSHDYVEPTLRHAQVTTALWVGDSYTAGAAGVVQSGTYASLACADLGWICKFDAQGGTGYVADGHVNSSSYSSYQGRLASIRERFATDYVIVTGGRNDANLPGVGQAVDRYYRDLRVAFPKAKIIALEPFWNNQRPPAQIVAVRRAVVTAAKKYGVRVINTGGWINPSLITEDKVHPSAAGHQAIAAKFVSEMQGAS